MAPVRIDGGRIVPWTFVMAGSFIIFFLYRFLYLNTGFIGFVSFGLLFSPVLPALWAARVILVIDPNKNTWHEFYWILGIKIGKPEELPDSIESVFLNKVPMARNMTSYGGKVHQENFYEYAGFIKFSDGTKKELSRRRNQQFMQKNLKKIADKLQVPFDDNSINKD